MGIALSALHVAVPERTADEHEILGGLVEQGPEGMAEGMDRKGGPNPGSAEPVREPVLHRSGREWPPLPADKQGLAGTRVHSRPRAEICSQDRAQAYWQVSPLPPTSFGSPQDQLSTAQIHIALAQADDIRQADSRIREGGKQRTISN